jgi:hypothetical protein
MHVAKLKPYLLQWNEQSAATQEIAVVSQVLAQMAQA